MTPQAAYLESSILERLVVSPESAKAVLSIKFTPDDEKRMRELMERNNRGTITEREQAEMESYRRVGAFLGIMQAKARLHLKKSGADS
jgi:hypothetical protein